MSLVSKTDAQRRVDNIHIFQEELSHLEQEKIISLSEEQRSSIKQYHNTQAEQFSSLFDIDHTKHQKQLSLGMKVTSFLGALALAASVFFLFYQFWGLLSTPTQIIILVTASVISFLATVYLSTKDTSGYFTKLAGLVSFACFVLNISMLGQIFNITPSDKAFIVWAAFAFLLAYAFDLRLLLGAGIICLTVFISARFGTWSGMYWINFGERPENFLPVAILLFLFPQLVNHARFTGFDSIFRVFALLIGFIPILILSNAGMISYINYDRNFIEGLYQIVGFVFSAAAIWLGIRKNWSDVMNTGTVFFVIFLYTKFYDWWWEIMPKYLFFLVLGLTALLFLFIFKRLRYISAKTDNEVTL